MRIISGIARGYKLFSINDVKIRPTADRVKEAIFNMIYSKVCESAFLDLYSGTGSIGIEALSRGAKKCVFVDNYTSNIIDRNLKYIDKVLKNYETKIIKLEVNKAIDKLYKNKEKFDIIFMDPPYNKGLVMKTLKKIYEKNILNKEGIIIVEQSKEDLKENIRMKEKYKILKSKSYGSISIIFLSMMEE